MDWLACGMELAKLMENEMSGSRFFFPQPWPTLLRTM
jgi:hypothetical protein